METGEPSQPQPSQGNLEFFMIGIRWVKEAKDMHDAMAEYLIKIALELQIEESERIIEVKQNWPSIDVVRDYERHIDELKEVVDDLKQNKADAEAKRNMAKRREMDALALVRNLE